MAPDAGGAVATEDLGSGSVRRFFESLPADVRGGLDERQRGALTEAVERFTSSSHATNIRLSIPLLTRRYYLVLLGGEERRSLERRAAERGRHPLVTPANVVCVLLLAICSTFVGGFLFTLILMWYLSL